MAQLRARARRHSDHLVPRCPPVSLLGRLVWLLVAAVLISQALALTLLSHWGHTLAGVGSDQLPRTYPLSGFVQTNWLLDIAALVLAAWLAERWLAAPLRRLTRAAKALGTNIHQVPLAERGARECRAAIRVFNQMQTRIRQQMLQRDQFVAAVSHDLRTPLARLSQLAQSLPDPLERQRFAKDIAEMDEMIRSTLDHLSGQAEAEPMALLDMGALLLSLAEDARDSAQDVQLQGELTGAWVLGQASALRRCLGNLVGNAVRCGQCARISLQDKAGQLHISVHDKGPGLPQAEFDKVLIPFYRLVSPRQCGTGGVGLGLASANDIARRHGGGLTLANHPDGGLVATLSLPHPARHTGAQR